MNIQAIPTPILFLKRGKTKAAKLTEMVTEVGFSEGSLSSLTEMVTEVGFSEGFAVNVTEMVTEVGFAEGGNPSLTEMVVEIGLSNPTVNFVSSKNSGYVPALSF